MRKFILALVIGVTASTSAFANTGSEEVFSSKDSWDVGAMYGANRNDNLQNDREVARVASLAPVALPAVVFSSLNSWDVPAMYGASRKAAAQTEKTAAKDVPYFIGSQIPGGP
jgi:hypothetical protein